jgi:hypothetical protein
MRSRNVGSQTYDPNSCAELEFSQEPVSLRSNPRGNAPIRVITGNFVIGVLSLSENHSVRRSRIQLVGCASDTNLENSLTNAQPFQFRECWRLPRCTICDQLVIDLLDRHTVL